MRCSSNTASLPDPATGSIPVLWTATAFRADLEDRVLGLVPDTKAFLTLKGCVAVDATGVVDGETRWTGCLRESVSAYGVAVLFAAETGLRPDEWIALERRDLDLTGRVVTIARGISADTGRYPMHEGSYDERESRFEVLAADRDTDTGRRLVEAAKAFKAAVVAHLEEWEDEYEANDSMQRPSRLRAVTGLFVAANRAVDHAGEVNAHRNLCFVLATEAA